MIIITNNADDIKNVKGSSPQSIRIAKAMNDDFSHGIAEFYKAVWKGQNNGLSIKNKHLMVFAIACSKNNTNSAKKILVKLKKHGALKEEIFDTMMMAAWVSGMQNFTNISSDIVPEMEKLGF